MSAGLSDVSTQLRVVRYCSRDAGRVAGMSACDDLLIRRLCVSLTAHSICKMQIKNCGLDDS